MPDREKVIKGLTLCMQDGTADEICAKCPYCTQQRAYRAGGCITDLMIEARTLLEEQEAVEPDGDDCGNCGYMVRRLNFDGPDKPLRVEFFRYCPCCGREVEWDAGKRDG